MSSHETLMTGRLPRPQPLSLGLYLQPPTETQASHSAKVTSNFPTANAFAIVTLCTGLLISDPIMTSPAGTTTISGHSGQSLNVSFGFRHRRSLATGASTPSQCAGAGGGALLAGGSVGLAGAGFTGGGGIAMATCCFLSS